MWWNVAPVAQCGISYDIKEGFWGMIDIHALYLHSWLMSI